jgi:hypothetical protein
MSYMGGNSRAPVDASHPSAWAICDRCGFLYAKSALQWQFYWAGLTLANTRFLVCQPCLDIPNPQFKTIILPPDPPPVLNARVADWAAEAGQNVPDDDTPVDTGSYLQLAAGGASFFLLAGGSGRLELASST